MLKHMVFGTALAALVIAGANNVREAALQLPDRESEQPAPRYVPQFEWQMTVDQHYDAFGSRIYAPESTLVGTGRFASGMAALPRPLGAGEAQIP
jgi:hypothetical protein